MIALPVNIVQAWRSPDREIHRLLTTQGPRSTTALRHALGRSWNAVGQSCDRLSRLGLVTWTKPHRRCVLWSAVSYDGAMARWTGGRTRPAVPVSHGAR
jgi:predicted transcriptional regulator